MNEKHKSTGVSDSLALGLLRCEEESNPGKNVVLSPLSVSLALGLTINGSRGKTREELASALGFGVGRSRRGINECYASLKEALAQSKEVDLEVANSLIGCGDMRFKKNFVNKASQYFDARIKLLDLENPAAAMIMNSFVCQKTKGKISSIVDWASVGAEHECGLHLLNAVYFNGLWQHGFDRLLTQSECFYGFCGERSDSALMYKSGAFAYYGNLDFQAVKLPYGKSGRFAMYVFLPLADGQIGLQRLFQKLETEGLSTCFKRFAPKRGELFLPRFKMEYAATLNDSLKKLGLVSAFSQDAEFGSMVESDSQRLTLKHKTVFELDEDGGEAVALDKNLTQSFCLPHLPFILRADRPFCFFVRDEATETVNVAGVLKTPIN